MEYAKDEIFQIRYNSQLNRLELGHERIMKRAIKKIKKNKLLSTIIFSFILFSIINVIMIYNFLYILQKL